MFEFKQEYFYLGFNNIGSKGIKLLIKADMPKLLAIWMGYYYIIIQDFYSILYQ